MAKSPRYFRYDNEKHRYVFSNKENATHVSNPDAREGTRIVKLRDSLKESYEIGKIENEARIRVSGAKRKGQSEYFRERQFREPIEHEPFTGSKTTSKLHIVDKEEFRRRLTNSLRETEEKITTKVSTAEKFEYSEVAEKRLGLTKSEQKLLYNIFKKANEEGENLGKLTDDLIKPRFSLRLDTIRNNEQLKNRIAAAEEVLSGDYLENIAKQYKQDFIQNFEFHLETDLYNKLKDKLEDMDDLDFLNYIKNNRVDYLAYALDSLITDYGYDLIAGEVRRIIRDA